MYYYHDTFCKCYWNKKTKEWQKSKTLNCHYSTRKEAEEDSIYIYDMENVELKIDYSHLAFAA